MLPAPDVEDAPVISEWLSQKRGHRCVLHRPQRGEKHRLMEMCVRNARHALMRYMMRTGYSDDRTNQALLQLESALALDAPPLRIECFDISTIHGKFTVASMVVFTNGHADKSQYRRFKIRAELEEANDFVSMSEVLGRRYAPERMADERFGSRPDLLVVDGGKPQLTAAMNQLEALVSTFPFAALLKADEESSCLGTIRRRWCFPRVLPRSISLSRCAMNPIALPSPSIASCATRR